MKTRFPIIATLLLTSYVLSSCGSSQSTLDARATSIVADVFARLTTEARAIAPTPLDTPFPTSTSVPTSVPTPIQTPTAMPGRLVFPIQSLSDSIPWLPWDQSAQLGVMYIGFGLTQPPFDNVLVRKAFAAAIDREAIATLAERLEWVDVQPATSFLHPEVLARDLYNDVGIPFDPEQAREYLIQAGYSDAAKFPSTTMVISIAGQPATGFYLQMADLLANMWRQHLKITVNVEDIGTLGQYYHYLETHDPQLFRISFITTEQGGNDPDSVYRYAFYTKLNVSNFTDFTFDALIDQAYSITDPIQRQSLYIQVERLVCEEHVVIIPLIHYSK